MMMLTKDTAMRMNINNRTDAEQSIKRDRSICIGYSTKCLTVFRKKIEFGIL